MKKSFWIAIFVGFLSFVMTAYGLIAFFMTRGLNVYLLSYKTGKLLVNTYLPILIVGGIGWVVAITLFIVSRAKKAGETPETTAQPTTTAADVLAKPVVLPEAQPTDTKQEPQKEELSAPIVAKEAKEAAQEAVEEAKEIVEAVTEEVNEASVVDEDATILEEEPEVPKEPVKMQAPTAKFCSKCGTALQEGFLFCMECGEKIS